MDKLYASGLPFDTAAETFSGFLPASKAELRTEISSLTKIINKLVVQVNALTPVSFTSMFLLLKNCVQEHKSDLWQMVLACRDTMVQTASTAQQVRDLPLFCFHDCAG